jgi:hypothetical protein
MSLQDYNAMLEAQGGACAVCRKKTKLTLCVDHCHHTGAVRGLLCVKCNAGLGCYEDQPSLMRAGADYLEIWLARKKQIAPPTSATTASKTASIDLLLVDDDNE